MECLQCVDVLCNNNDHSDNIEKLHDDIISASIKASEFIPMTGQCKKKFQVGMKL